MTRLWLILPDSLVVVVGDCFKYLTIKKFISAGAIGTFRDKKVIKVTEMTLILYWKKTPR